MSNLEHLPQKEVIDLLNKCWMTHDGMWFFHCLQELGIKQTNKLNKSAFILRKEFNHEIFGRIQRGWSRTIS